MKKFTRRTMTWTVLEFCKQLPKIELHAHLNGSLSRDTLQKLHKMKTPDSDVNLKLPDPTKIQNLDEVFAIFSQAHSLTSTLDGLRIATRDVVKEFAEDGGIHLELRTTPREVAGTMTREEYVEIVVTEAARAGAEHAIGVKVMLSVDRRHSVAVAEETLGLVLAATQRWPGIVVGLDLSGDPSQGNAVDFLPVLTEARRRGLYVAAHCAEVENEAETVALIESGVAHRLGHCTRAVGAGAARAWDALRRARLPVELCLSSNVLCRTVPSYAAHHLGALRAARHPLVLCTDDKGVFSTTLSHEYYLAATHFSLSKNELWEMCYESVNYCFATDEEKKRLQDLLLSWKKHMFLNFND